MRLYHFTKTQHALDDIRNQRLKIATFDDLNDPFELLCVDLSREEHALAFEMYKKEMASRFGVLCFTEVWKSILQWSHYAEHHRGMCLGFDVSYAKKFGQIEYKSGKIPFPKGQLDGEFSWKILSTKYKGWEYEKEWRVFLTLETPTWSESARRGLYFAEFGADLLLREVILGAENPEPLEDVFSFLGHCSDSVQVFKVQLSASRFELTRNEVKQPHKQ